MEKLAIITGTSRGLGYHLALDFLNDGYRVIGIARSNSIEHPDFHFLKADLGRKLDLQGKLASFLKKKKIAFKNDEVVLVNNAATVLPIDAIHNLKEEDIILSYFLNLNAPVQLSQFVLKRFLAKTRHLTVCNLSSGAAVRPLVDWSIYCSMKSALKMFTDCLNAEYGELGKLKAFSFFPGIMDTQMQATIRKQNPKKFRSVESFRQYKEDKKLLAPEMVSKSLFQILRDPAAITKTEYDIRDFKG